MGLETDEIMQQPPRARLRGSVGASREVSMKAYSKEFRGEVLAACDRERSTREAATHFNVSESWVRWVKQERRELPTGSFSSTKREREQT